MDNYGNFQQPYQPVPSKQKKKKWPYILGGFLSVFVGFGLFYFGLMVGSGQISLSFNRTAVQENESLPNKLNYESVDQVYKTLKQKYDGQLDEQKLLLGLKKGLVEAAGDPYTTYLDASEAKELNETLNGSFSGIGAELGKDGQFINVVAPISGFPAEKAGLRAKDIIITIDDEDATGLNVDEAVKKIRGEKGTKVKLGVIRGEERLNFEITRDTITIPSVETKMLEGNVGYIKLSRFAEDTAGLIEAAANDFKSKNVKAVVLDLRNDPGGYLNAAVQVSCQWQKQGQKVVDEKRGQVVLKTHSCDKDGILTGVKTVVLINDGSASASEITAGALKDNGAATLVGVKSYGKGSVQEMADLDGGDILKVTVAKWFTPSGKNIDKEGIKPDVEVKMTDEDIKNNADPQLVKAQELAKQ